MKLQVSKAEQVVRHWGVPTRRFRDWMDRGIVQAVRQGEGRGSMRLLTDASLLDAFLASQLLHDLSSERTLACLRAARPLYRGWLRTRGPFRVVFELSHPQHSLSARIQLDPVLRVLTVLRTSDATQRVERGRKPRRWQDEFADLLADVGRELRAAEPSLPPLEETIRTYRTARSRGGQEVRVTVPA